MTDPTPDVPVFRLVRETTELSAAERYRLAVACGLVDASRQAVRLCGTPMQ